MTTSRMNRRRILRDFGLGAAALPFLSGLTSLRANESTQTDRRKRLVIMFSPNGTLPDEFWPDQFGADVPLQLKAMLSPLEPFRKQTLILKGVNNKIKGDGDGHMRGMSCLLTATELDRKSVV